MATILKEAALVAHPLEPLSAEEIERATAIACAERQLGERARFVTISLVGRQLWHGRLA